MSKRYILDLKSRLNRFTAAYGDKLCSEISTAMIDDWLMRLNLTPVSINNYRRVLHVCFDFAQNRSFVSTNPVSKAAKIKEIETLPEIFSVQEINNFFEHADSELVVYLAIGAFAGLRSSELDLLDWQDIDLDAGYIHVAAEKSKTARRRLVKILPNLKKRLVSVAKVKGLIRPINLSKRRRALCSKIGIKWPNNALRHSFASYHLAHFNNAAELALQLGHTGTSLLFRHYRELVKPSEAAKWWEL